MNSQKQHRNDKLQKSSVLFLQLGLVLALFLAYTALEFESIKTKLDFTVENQEDPEIEIAPDKIFTIERPETKPIEQKTPSKSLVDIEIVPDDIPTPTAILDPIDKDPEPSIDDQIGKLPGNDTEPVEPPVDDIIFEKIEDAPIFPGCEGLEKLAAKQCFTNGISKFVNRKFNTGIADDLTGKQKIWVQFVVDKTGTVTDIQARSHHKKLEKEAIRVVKKLPQMTPGKQRKRAVNVKYTLPIIFHTY